MKRFLPVLLLLCCGISSFAAEQSDQYCYVFNQDDRIQEKDAHVLHSVNKNDWFLSDKLYNPEKDAYATIDGKTYKARLTYHLMTEEEYEKILSGKKVVNDQDKLAKWFKSNIPANKLVWDKEKARIAKREADIARYSRMIPFKTVNNWTLLLLLLPFIIPVVLLFVVAMKYGDQRLAGGDPSVARPWLAVLLVFLLAAIGYFYGRFLFLAFQGLDCEVHVSRFLFIVIAIILVITLLYSTVSIKKEMLAFYKVKFGADKIAIAILVAIASLLGVAAVQVLVQELFHLPDGFADEPVIMAATIGLSLIAPIIYIRKTILKQNSDAHMLLVPLLVFAVFGAVTLALGGIFFVLLKGSSAPTTSGSSSSNNEPDHPGDDCRNCYFYGAWECQHPKSYGVCSKFVHK